MAVKIQFRRGTASQWSSANPTLDAGEVGVETDSGRFKVGDGTTAWNSLDYALAPAAYGSINTQSGTTYTIVADDGLRLTSFTSSSPITVTIPPNSSVPFPTGSRVDIVQYGTGTVTVSGDTGVTVQTGTTAETRTQYSVVSAIKMDTDTWMLVGDLAVI